MGTELLTFYQEKVKKEWKTAFSTTVIAFLLVHLYKITNTLPNHDSLYNVYFDQDMTASGRWFLTYACGISSYFDLPWINALLCATYLGITTAMVTEIFNLKNPVVIGLSGALLSASICTTETMFFEFTADGYLMGLMLAVAAAVLSVKEKCSPIGTVLSGICLCLSCAIYQAYISFAVVLCICHLINRLLNGEMTVRAAWKWIGRHVLIYGAALAVYYFLWKVILLANGQTAVDYQGINTVGQVSLSTIIGGAVKSLKNLFFFFLEWNILEHPVTLYAALNIVFLLCLGAVFIVALVKSSTFKKPAVLGTVLFALAASIPVISIWCFLSDGVEYHPMMLHSVLVYYIFALILFDRWVQPKFSTIFGLFMAVMIFNFAVMANISYFYLDNCYEKSYYMGSRMMEDIEEAVQNADEEIESIVFVGSRAADVAVSETEPGCNIHILSVLLESDLLYDHTHAYLYLKGVFDLDIPGATAQYREELEENAAVKDMGVWPANDSVGVVDNTLVVKLNESQE